MEVDYRAQFILAFMSVPAGFLLGAVYDVLRLVRIPVGKIGVFFTDLLQAFLCFFAVQILLFNYWSGKIRLYPFVICFVSLVVYRLTVGRFLTAVALRIKAYISPRLSYRVAAVKGYFYKKRLLKYAINGFGIKLPRRKRSGKENTS